MTSYLVLEPQGTAADRAEKAVIVRDGFAFLAFLLPLFWFLWHRMWLEALAFLAIALLLGALGLLPGYATPASLVSIALSILVGFEAQALRVAMLCRHGWSIWGVVEGRNSTEAELRYTAEIEPDLAGRNLAAVPPAGATAHKPPAERRTVGTAFGLLDYPERS